jgi:uncharacterized damage-inducible protein DinB
MTPSEPAITFHELLTYTDHLANRWMDYFAQNPKALDINIGGRTGPLLELVNHIFTVEQFFAGRLRQKEPPAKLESPTLQTLMELHKVALAELKAYVTSATDEDLHRTQSLGQSGTVSNRKILAQVALHCVHHWAQVAMAVRQAGFPADTPQDFILTGIME